MLENKGPYHILLVDDDELVHKTVAFEYADYSELKFESAFSGEEALVMMKEDPFKYAVVLLDYQMNGLDGAETAKAMLELNPEQYILICSSDGSRDALKRSFKAGVVEFLEKNISTEEKVEKIFNYCHQFEKNQQVNNPVFMSIKNQQIMDSVNMVGSAPQSVKLAQDILTVAQYDGNVLIRGETGVGKELVAQGIHDHSNRRNKKFVVINCGAISKNLIESELFGHAKGSFTGAHVDKKGKFQEANGGTVFLDEIGDMPFDVQVKLLRVLQQGEIEPIGKLPIKVDVRVIAATHVNLEKNIKNKLFREDLFFRLNVLGVTVPPLRDRIDDVDMLVEHFNKKYFVDPKPFTKGAVAKLKLFDWPGNIRQLENAVRRLDIVAENDFKIRAEHLTNGFFKSISSGMDSEKKVNIDSVEDLKSQIDELERAYWKNQLVKTSSITQMAKNNNVAQATLYRKLSSLGLEYKNL